MPNFSKDQRNEIYRAVASSELDLAECDFASLAPVVLDLAGAVEITHVPSESEFRIVNSIGIGRFSLQSKFGDDPLPPVDVAISFKDILSKVRVWADKVAEWVDTPDLWKDRPVLGGIPGDLSPETDNTAFTPDEQALVSVQLREIREAVKKTYELTANQSEHIDEKFEEAEKASRRMGRKDWGMFFGGALLSLILSDTITPAIMGDILIMVQHGIGHLFMGGASVRGILSAGQD